MENKVLEQEVYPLTEAIKGFSQNYNPKVLFCMVDKRVSHRLCENGNGYMNPAPGTVVDTGLVEK